jgi:hypothetical protein
MQFIPGGGGGGSATWQGTVRTASSAALPAYTRTGNDIVANAVGALPSVGGVSLVVDDDFLLRNGASAIDNWLYRVVALGDGATPYSVTRTPGAATSAGVSDGMRVPISEGVFTNQTFRLVAADPVVLNTTPLNPELVSPPQAVVWNPGAAPDPANYLTTWAEVMIYLTESTGEFTVTLDDSGGGAFAIPSGTYNLDSRLRLSRPAPAEGQLTVVVADGAVLQNLAGVYRNITLQVNPTAAPALELSNGRAIEFDLGAILENAGSYAALEVAAGETVGLSFYRDSRALATSDVIADLTAATATLNATFRDNSQASTSWVSGIAGTTLDYRVDAAFTEVTLASPPATVGTTQVDNAATTIGNLWPLLDFQIDSGSIILTAGNFTNGHRFRPLKNFTITGIRLYWAGAPAVSLKCSIWNEAGVLQATKTVVTSGIGIYTATFTTPVAAVRTAGQGPTSWWSYGIYETTGANYTRIAATMIGIGIFDGKQLLSFSYIWDMTTAMFVAGDGRPTGTVGNTIPSELLFA